MLRQTYHILKTSILTTRSALRSATHRYFGQFESTPGGWVYHTPAGYYDLARGQHYWYVRDRMGSTAAVVDAAGNMVQTTGYYPSGTPYQLPNTAIGTAVDAKTDRLHIGNRWLGHSGLAMYDNTARLHDPLLMRFAAPDPLYSRYPGLSPWSHTAANPLNLIDPDGQDVYTFDAQGNLVEQVTDKTKDLVTLRIDDNNSISSNEMRYGTIESCKRYSNGKGGFYDIIQIRGAANGREIFEMFAENTGIEFSLFTTGDKGNGPCFLSTSHEEASETAGGWLFCNQLRFGYHIISFDHNHPRGTEPSCDDITAANCITKILSRRISFNVYRRVHDSDNINNYHYEYMPF